MVDILQNGKMNMNVKNYIVTEKKKANKIFWSTFKIIYF